MKLNETATYPRSLTFIMLLMGLLWNSAVAQTPDRLPAANHPILFGYYFEDAARYGDFQDEVIGYTNSYLAIARSGYEKDSTATDEEWLVNMRQALKRVAADGNRKILLNLNRRDSADRIPPVEMVIGAAAPFWEHIALIDLADEPSWNKAAAEAEIRAVRQAVRDHGLEPRPIGFVLEKYHALTTDAVEADGLDFVGVEAYVDPPGDDDPAKNAANLRSYIDTMKSRVPANKKLLLVMQAYDRNGKWTNIQTLKDLQYQTYLLAHDDPRIIAITMFAYGRPGGTRDHPELQAAHRRIAEAVGITGLAPEP